MFVQETLFFSKLVWFDSEGPIKNRQDRCFINGLKTKK